MTDSQSTPSQLEYDDELRIITPEFVQQVQDAIEDQDKKACKAMVKPLEAEDLADLFEYLSPEDHQALVGWISKDQIGDLLTEVDEDIRDQIVENMATKDLATALKDLDSDDAVHVIEDLSEEDQQAVLGRLPEQDRALIEDSLSYPEDTAGRLMQHEVVTVPSHWDVGTTIDFMRNEKNGLPEEFYEIFVVNPRFEVIGLLSVSKLLRHSRKELVEDLIRSEFKSVPAMADQEDVAHLFRTYGLISAPVINESGRLLGRITVDDVMDVMDEEAEEDLMRLGGVGTDDLYLAVLKTSRLRFWWLGVNLLTAFFASLVIAQFSDALETIVALAILMPIVASMAGNAGTQTLTVTVRALAMRELSEINFSRLVGKEILVGTLNGVLFAGLTAGAAYLWFSDLSVAIIIAASTVASLMVANCAGAAIPYTLDRLKIDPAIASGVFLTTVTDVMAFATFLGLSTLFLL